MDTPISELPIERRCDLAISLARNPGSNSPELFLVALDCNPSFPPAMNYQNREGITLLHASAKALGILSARSTKISPFSRGYGDYELWISGWKSILQQLVISGANLHVTCPLALHTYFGLGHVRATSLLDMLFSLFYIPKYKLVWIKPQNAMNSWISILSDCGVDLIEYGLREKSTWNSVAISTNYWPMSPGDPFSDYYFGQRRLIGFDYGQSPKNWILWENEPTDEFAGEFWLMLDRKEEIMPGTWID